MQLVTTLAQDTQLRDVPAAVARFERLGFDTVHVPETVHDSLSVALLALEHTHTLQVRTSMTLAFVRSPMVVAYAAWDLARFSGGRFALGLATGVRGTIEGRFATGWSQPVARLGDYVRALRAIFTAFADGGPLRYEGTHYRFTRLPPYFNPGPLDTGAPAIFTGGVNRGICELAGRVADGFVTHPTSSHPRILARSVLPALRAGAAQEGRTSLPRLVVGARALTAPSAEALAAARVRVRREMAFLFSTPAYRGALEELGFNGLGEQLTRMVSEQRWDELTDLLPDEVLTAIVPQGTYAELPGVLARAYSGRCDELSVSTPVDDGADDQLAAVLEAVRMIPGLA